MVLNAPLQNNYVMKISRLTVDKLGVKLYDRVAAVIAELVSNSFDADATEVKIKAPMNLYLATKQGNELVDCGYEIEVEDNGIGMTPEEINKFYLRIGSERRNDERGDLSRKFNRKVMGRKGVGKLAPFGICQKIEILTSGGEKTTGKNKEGQEVEGYLTAHLTLDASAILQDHDEDYRPEIGILDGTIREKTGTSLKLSKFIQRKVPDIEVLVHQLSHRFGRSIALPDWEVTLIDSTKTDSDPNYSRKLGSFDIDKMENTEICFNADGNAVSSDGNIFPDLKAGFEYEGKFYSITGWAAYSKKPHKDDLSEGIRIYCRGKIAGQTTVFNRGASFSGELSIRSYLIGELNADWLDEEEDLIQTDRRDILWSHDLGQEFEKWGLGLLKKIGNMSRDPLKKKTWDVFKETSNIEEKIDQAFPRDNQKVIREQAIEFAELIGKKMRMEEAESPERTEDIVQLSLMFAPHVTLDKALREAGEVEGTSVSVITEILKVARLAELSSFGRIADDRVKVINKVETLKDNADTLEAVFQSLITEAPWLIDPQWSPLTSNQSFSTLKKEFQKYYREETGDNIELENFSDPNKRTDFVLASHDNVIQIIEIKRPKHEFDDSEMIRLEKYADLMEGFLNTPANSEFKKVFTDYHITLVCDYKKLTGNNKRSFDYFTKEGKLTYMNWANFLLRTRKMHQDFLNEAQRQKQDAAGEVE
ncbi:ATP-binding protein [Pseudanabaena minima]|uniref:ATP-binding protein n=1 Tax=Pseudanabaena minima TaxID=890415 RepID=UPI003DA94067